MKLVGYVFSILTFSIIVFIAFSTIVNVYMPYRRIEPSHLPPKIKLLSVLYENVYKLFSLEDIRKGIKAQEVPSDEIVDVEIGTYICDETTLSTYIYRTKNTSNDDIEIVFLYFHSGGFVWGHPSNVYRSSRELIKRIEVPIVVYAPEYRLTPETPKIDEIFDDAYNSYLNLLEKFNTATNEKLVVLVGESAGGRIATIVARRIRDEGYEKLGVSKDALHVMMFYPYLCHDEDICKDLESRKEFAFGALTSQYFDKYLKGFNHFSENAEYSSVFSAPYEDLPSHEIINPSFDYYRDEGKMYHDILLENHVESEYHEVSGELHSFLSPENIVELGVDDVYQKFFVDLVMKRFHQKIKRGEEDPVFVG